MNYLSREANADLDYIAAWVLEHAEEFDMETWGCGAVGCIAYQECKLHPLAGISPWGHIRFRAQSLLGLNDDQTGELFYVTGWPPEFEARYKVVTRLFTFRMLWPTIEDPKTVMRKMKTAHAQITHDRIKAFQAQYAAPDAGQLVKREVEGEELVFA